MENPKNKSILKNPWLYVSVILIAGLVFLTVSDKIKTRDEIIRDFENGIIELKEQGKYKCCIEPACTMCYLGHWIFENGECYCDDKIAEGKMDEVCPECKSGIEKSCSSKLEGCEIKTK